MRTFKINSLSNSQLNIIINDSHHGIHHIPTTYFITRSMYFDHLYPFHPLPPTQITCLLATTNLHSVPMSLFFVFQIPHVFVRSYSICLSLTYFTRHNALKIHPCCCKWQYFLLFMVKCHPLCLSPCVWGGAHFLYPFTHQWTFRLLPCLGYYK